MRRSRPSLLNSFRECCKPNRTVLENGEKRRSRNEHPAELNLSQTVGSAISSGIGVGSDVQKPIPSTLRSGGCEEYENNLGSRLLSGKMCETSKNVGEILRVAM